MFTVQSLSKALCLRSLIKPRLFSCSTVQMGAYDAEFTEAQTRLKGLQDDPGNEAKLKLYSLFKQATIGKCNVPKPGMMDFVGKAKWDAWSKLGDMTQDDAQKTYIDFVTNLCPATSSAAEVAPAQTDAGEYKCIKVEEKPGMNVITFNRPKKKNAITVEMYNEIMSALKSLGNNSAAITVVTGAGDYFSSGNDLGNFMNIDPSSIAQHAKDAGVLLENYVASFIDHPKPMIAVVNGPAIGVSVTVLGLFEAVYASDKATFTTPFAALGQSPEGCSSYTFPKIMGTAKACDLMLFGRTFSAAEACAAGLVSEVIPHDAFQHEVWARLNKLAQLPKQSLQFSKNLIRETELDILHKTNKRECDLLVERWQSQECMEAIMKFFQRKSSL